MKMFTKIINKLTSARTSGTVHRKNAAHIESIKVIDYDTEFIRVEIVVRKGEKLKLVHFYPTTINRTINRTVLSRVTKPGHIDTISIDNAIDLMGNETRAFSLMCDGRVSFTSYENIHFSPIGTLGGTRGVIRIN